MIVAELSYPATAIEPAVSAFLPSTGAIRSPPRGERRPPHRDRDEDRAAVADEAISWPRVFPGL